MLHRFLDLAALEQPDAVAQFGGFLHILALAGADLGGKHQQRSGIILWTSDRDAKFATYLLNFLHFDQ